MKNEKLTNNVFEDEYNSLEQLFEDISNDNVSNEDLLLRIKSISNKLEKSMKFAQKLSKISDIQGKELKRTESEIKGILDNSNQGFLTFDQNYIISNSYSKECRKIFDKKIGRCNILDLLKNINTSIFELLENNLKKIFEIRDDDLIKPYLDVLPEMFRINNKYISVKYRTLNLNEKFYIMLVLTDITSEILNKQKLEHLYYFDSLTDLHNRAYVEKIIPIIKKEKKYPVGVIFGDMNGLKFTNDVYGHEKGDQLLKTLSNILKQSCWCDEIIIRWAGDEFLVIVLNASIEILKMICSRIKSSCQNIRWDPVGPNISLGYALQNSEEFDFGELFKLSEKEMYKNKIHESPEVKRQIILGMKKILEKKYLISQKHIERVRDLTIKTFEMGEFLLTPTEMNNVEMASILHDIGKILIPVEILNKQTKLSEEDWKLIKSHSEIGYRMAQSINELGIANTILYIHEKWDGSGYPEGLIGEQIPFASRVIALAEAFDVMTHEQPYKNAISIEEAVEEIRRCSGTQFDPDLAKLFINKVINNK
jgi:diguanylate cyclase (GGDEF)-like protein